MGTHARGRVHAITPKQRLPLFESLCTSSFHSKYAMARYIDLIKSLILWMPPWSSSLSVVSYRNAPVNKVGFWAACLSRTGEIVAEWSGCIRAESMNFGASPPKTCWYFKPLPSGERYFTSCIHLLLTLLSTLVRTSTEAWAKPELYTTAAIVS